MNPLKIEVNLDENIKKFNDNEYIKIKVNSNDYSPKIRNLKKTV